MRKYDHLFFDLDNTLLDFTANSRLAMKQMLDQNNILPKSIAFDDFFKVYEQINKSLWSDYHFKKITKQELIVERFSRSLLVFGITDMDWKEINHHYLENMAIQTGLYPNTLETLGILRSRGYLMYIITNGFREVQRAKLANCGLDGFFTKVFISEELQTTKPHRKIFEHALKSTNASKMKSIMIGDSWETDIAGALDFGMDQIMFLNGGLHELPREIESKLSTANATCLELKPQIRTYFIDEIPDLITIL